MDANTFCHSMANVRSLPAAFSQYLVQIAEKLPPGSRQRIVDSCVRADKRIANALKICIKKLSSK